MEFGPSTYGDAFADVYDEWYGELPGVDGLVSTVSAGGIRRRVLELGAGTGRVAIPLAAAGHHVVALDASDAMLDRLRSSLAGTELDIEPVLGDAGDAADVPDGPFDVVLAPFNLLFNLADRAAQQRCLRRAAEILAPDGVVIVECMVPSLPAQAGTTVTTRKLASGETVTIETSVDPAASVIEGVHVQRLAGGEVRRRWRLCVASVDEIDALAGAAGLELLTRTADWDGSPFEADESSHHVSVYGGSPPPPRR